REPPELELSIVELAAGDPAGSSPAPGGAARGEPGAGELSFGMILRRGADARGRHADISDRGGGRAVPRLPWARGGEARRPGGPWLAVNRKLSANTGWANVFEVP